MTKYYEVVGLIDGETEVLYGSFIREDCMDEKDAEKESWLDQGYRCIKVVSRETTDTPDGEVYEGQIVTKRELWMQQAPAFNFELDEDGLLDEALVRGFVTPLTDSPDNDRYIINQDY